jgi:hypothetical protein
MSWQVLIVHGKQPAALSAKLQLMAEFEDVVVRTALSPEEGLARLAEESFDLVLCELDPADPSWLEFRESLVGSAGLRPPLVMMLSSPDEGLETRLAQEGCHCLPAPYSPRQLREAVLRAFNPRNRRRFDRLSIPGVEVNISMDGQEVQGQVYNLSLRGMLCAFELPVDAVDLLGPAALELHFGMREEPLTAAGIQACLLRLSVDCHHDGLFPRTVRSAWKFVEVPAPAEEVLARVLEEAARALGELGEQGLDSTDPAS